MTKIKILIADDNVLVAQKLYNKLNVYEDFELIISRDGIETIELINKETPDVVLLDIIMPKLDGIGVLEYAKVNIRENKPVFIVFSAISQENYISRVMELGANYYILKPFDEEVIALRIRQLYSDKDKEQINKSGNQTESLAKKLKNSYDDELMILATKYMREYGLKAHMTGYCYIRDIITTSFDHYCQNGSTIPKGIYRIIANKNNVSVQKVERAIRNCIENVKAGNDLEKKPTNFQVICMLIEKIRINN